MTVVRREVSPSKSASLGIQNPVSHGFSRILLSVPAFIRPAKLPSVAFFRCDNLQVCEATITFGVDTASLSERAAQMNPASSRATAVTALLVDFP
jgi:hypothetical protein